MQEKKKTIFSIRNRLIIGRSKRTTFHFSRNEYKEISRINYATSFLDPNTLCNVEKGVNSSLSQYYKPLVIDTNTRNNVLAFIVNEIIQKKKKTEIKIIFGSAERKPK